MFTCITSCSSPSHLTSTLTLSCYPVTSPRDSAVDTACIQTVVTIIPSRTNWWLKIKGNKYSAFHRISIISVLSFYYSSSICIAPWAFLRKEYIDDILIVLLMLSTQKQIILWKKPLRIIFTCITSCSFPSHLTSTLTVSRHPVTFLRDATVDATFLLTVVTIIPSSTGWWLKKD